MKTLLYLSAVLALVLVPSNACKFCTTIIHVSTLHSNTKIYLIMLVLFHITVHVPRRPVDCRDVFCTAVACVEGISVTLPGECCPRCIPTQPRPWFCPLSPCFEPDCSEEDRFTPEGECCPVCRETPIDCNKVDCVQPVCKLNQELFTPEGECCPICQPQPPPDCSLVRCPLPLYTDGELVTPNGECCPICKPHLQPDCSKVLCAIPPRDDGKLVTPKGECCPICHQIPPPNCSLMRCLYTTCLYWWWISHSWRWMLPRLSATTSITCLDHAVFFRTSLTATLIFSLIYYVSTSWCTDSHYNQKNAFIEVAMGMYTSL